MTTKVSIVTGAGRGIGKAFAGILLKERYKVAIFDIDETTGKQTADAFSTQFGSGSCEYFKCDVTDSQQIKDCYSKVEEMFGKVSLVGNVTGILTEERWSKMIDVNLKAVIDITYIAVEKMRKDKGGNGATIVNVASVLGLDPHAGFTSYVASKWGVVGFTQSMVASLALAEQHWGISMMLMCPPAVDTVMHHTVGAAAPVDKMTMSPGVPVRECKTLLSERFGPAAMISMDEMASAFQKLLQDNKNGSVMTMSKEKDAPAKFFYIKQQWNEIE